MSDLARHGSGRPATDDSACSFACSLPNCAQEACMLNSEGLPGVLKKCAFLHTFVIGVNFSRRVIGAQDKTRRFRREIEVVVAFAGAMLS